MKRVRLFTPVLIAVVGSCMSLVVGCGKPSDESSTTTTSPSDDAGMISPQKFADAVHAVMMADRTVYAKHVVTNLKKQNAPVSPSEYWEDEEHKIPLPAQMFRMGSEIVNEDSNAGFTYALKSLWPLNPQNKAAEGVETQGLNAIKENPDEPFYETEEISGKKYFTAIYADRAVAEACWDCHNNHPNKGDDYPEFAEGDTMGGVVVRVPLN